MSLNCPSLSNITEAHDLWLKVVPVFVIDGAPSQVPMSSNHREMITGNFSSNSRKIVKCAHPNSISLMGLNPNMKLAKSGAISKLKNHYVYLDKNILEGLRKAQYVAFLAIKVTNILSSTDDNTLHFI